MAVTARVTVGASPVAAVTVAPWTPAAPPVGATPSATAAAAVAGLLPLTNRRTTSNYLWCANATDGVGFLVKYAHVWEDPSASRADWLVS
jgi:hypothetical protein